MDSKQEVDSRVLKDGVACHCFSPDLTGITPIFSPSNLFQKSL